ncbi:glycosyltransferase family 2 protein [Prevotella sp. HUN102]|uniref:glycosyltransferase family 2 protein n=1 Tax=Prevotella sp. HUN102 TaxID=1392486 RepID=UPI0004909F17|nr:glycosyltransferase family 2 protein [Prevotella sp. HUN102]
MKISIVTATFNSEATIADTINSVLSQDYKDIEYIIVDGGSTDKTMEIVKSKIQEFGNRLKYISESDKGIYDAMNKGIRMASGEIVGILNSDDYYTSSDVLSTYAKEFSDKNIDAVYGDIHFIRENEPSKIARYYSSRIFRPSLLRFGFMPAHPSFYLRRSVYEKAGLYSLDYKIGSDFEMMVRLFKKNHITYKYIAKDVVTMRMGGASTNGVGSHYQLLKEDTRACKSNGIFTHPLLISLKYIYKVFEFKLW